MKRGLYVISTPRRQEPVNLLEIAQILYGPSFVSLESSLQYHSLIPEAIHGVTSVTSKRSNRLSTPLGVFAYEKIPLTHFLLGVERVQRDLTIFFVAVPWRAIADMIYLRNKEWNNVEDLCEDLRIEQEELAATGTSVLNELAESYPDNRTRMVLTRLIGDFA